MVQEPGSKSATGVDQTTLAFERTFLAHERTLMAWIRTATSLIAFGFTLYQFFMFLREEETARPIDQWLGPRMFGLLMIGTGVVTLALATWQHHRQLKRLRPYEAPFSLSLVVAVLIAVLGILGFVAVLLRQ